LETLKKNAGDFGGFVKNLKNMDPKKMDPAKMSMDLGKTMGVEIPNLPNSKVEACKIILLTLLKKIKENIKETPEESKMYVKMLCVNMFTFDRVYKTPQEFMLKFKTFSDNMKQSIAMEKKIARRQFCIKSSYKQIL